MQERKALSETSDEGKKGKKKWEYWGPRLTLVVAIATLAIEGLTFYHQKKYDDYQQQKDKKEEQEQEAGHRPHFASEQGGKIPVGLQNYYLVYLSNQNEEIDISSGTFGFAYLVVLDTEEGEQMAFSWEEMFAYSEVDFDKSLEGCYLFVREDYSACENQVRELCGKVDVQDYACHSYIFFCFRYVQNGQEKDIYYLLEWKGDGSCGAIELTEPDELDLYKEAIPMKL